MGLSLGFQKHIWVYYSRVYSQHCVAGFTGNTLGEENLLTWSIAQQNSTSVVVIRCQLCIIDYCVWIVNRSGSAKITQLVLLSLYVNKTIVRFWFHTHCFSLWARFCFSSIGKNQFHKFFISFTIYISQYTILTNLTFLQSFSAKLHSFPLRYSHFFITFPKGRIKKTSTLCRSFSNIHNIFLTKYSVMIHQVGVVDYQSANGVQSQHKLCRHGAPSNSVNEQVQINRKWNTN